MEFGFSGRGFQSHVLRLQKRHAFWTNISEENNNKQRITWNSPAFRSGKDVIFAETVLEIVLFFSNNVAARNTNLYATFPKAFIDDKYNILPGMEC